MNRWRGIVGLAIAAAALAYLVAMVVSGSQPKQRQLAEFEAMGFLKVAPERVRRLEVSRARERIILTRRSESGWATASGAALDAESGRRISMAVQMMHTSGPTRTIPPEELAQVDEAAFGFDPPRIVATLYDAGPNPIMTIRFGGNNPDGFLQYMRVDGDPNLYVMSRFVGEEWTQALSRSLSQ